MTDRPALEINDEITLAMIRAGAAIIRERSLLQEEAECIAVSVFVTMAEMAPS